MAWNLKLTRKTEWDGLVLHVFVTLVALPHSEAARVRFLVGDLRDPKSMSSVTVLVPAPLIVPALLVVHVSLDAPGDGVLVANLRIVAGKFALVLCGGVSGVVVFLSTDADTHQSRNTPICWWPTYHRRQGIGRERGASSL